MSALYPHFNLSLTLAAVYPVFALCMTPIRSLALLYPGLSTLYHHFIHSYGLSPMYECDDCDPLTEWRIKYYEPRQQDLSHRYVFSSVQGSAK